MRGPRMTVRDEARGERSRRIGSSARVPLNTVGTAGEQRTQGVVRLDEGPPESWRVTLGLPIPIGVGQVVTAATAPVTVPNVSWGVTQPPRAVVQWGVDGVALEAEIDWRRGASFVLHASYINVAVVALQITEPGVPASLNFVVFPAIIAPSYSVTGPVLPPSRTFTDPAILAGNTADFPVPAFARAVRITRVAGATPPEVFEITGFANPLATAVTYFDQFSAAAGRNTQDYANLITFPVHPGTLFYRVRNGPGTLNNQGFAFEYELDLG